MEIKVDQIATSPTSLRLGCVVIGEQNSWVKFCEVQIPYELIPYHAIRDILLYGRPDQLVETMEDTHDPLF